MNEQDLREAFDRMVAAGPAPCSGAELVAAGRRRRRAVAVTAAAGAAAIVALVTVLAVAPLRPRPETAAGPVTAADVATPLAVPGRTAAELRSMALDCATAYAGGAGDPHGVLRRTAAQFRIFNSVRDAAGSMSVIYLPGAEITCSTPAGTTDTLVEVRTLQRTSVDWVPGAVSLDFRDGSRGAPDGATDFELLGGRVTTGAATVTVTGADGARTVPVVNGTYLTRFVASNGRISVLDPVTIRAYDRAGTPLGEVPEGRTWDCYRLPSGRQVSEPGPDAGKTCPTAMPWAGP